MSETTMDYSVSGLADSPEAMKEDSKHFTNMVSRGIAEDERRQRQYDTFNMEEALCQLFDGVDKITVAAKSFSRYVSRSCSDY